MTQAIVTPGALRLLGGDKNAVLPLMERVLDWEQKVRGDRPEYVTQFQALVPGSPDPTVFVLRVSPRQVTLGTAQEHEDYRRQYEPDSPPQPDPEPIVFV